MGLRRVLATPSFVVGHESRFVRGGSEDLSPVVAQRLSVRIVEHTISQPTVNCIMPRQSQAEAAEQADTSQAMQRHQNV